MKYVRKFFKTHAEMRAFVEGVETANNKQVSLVIQEPKNPPFALVVKTREESDDAEGKG